MDETKQTTQDSLPEKGQTSEGGSGTTSKTPETYTKEQVEKQVSDALAQAGRDAKSLSAREETLKAREASIQASETEMAKWLKEKDDADLEQVRGNPEALDLYQQRRALKVERAELEQHKTALKKSQMEHQAELEAIKQTTWEVQVRDIASKYGADPVQLKSLNLSSIEQVESVAKVLGKTAAGSDASPQGKQPFTPDSGMTTGGGKDLSGKSPLELATEAYSKKIN